MRGFVVANNFPMPMSGSSGMKDHHLLASDILCQNSQMDRLLILPVLLLTLLVGTPASSADFQKGLTAYRSGDYATALREWTPLAKQGDAEGSQTGRAIYPHASDSELFLIGISQLELFR